MMLDITNRISLWVSCCSEVSDRWFKELENGEDEFLRVEEALFSSLVLSAIETVDRPSLIESYGLLTAEYRKDVDDARSVCRKQKAGNIFCSCRAIKQIQGTRLRVKSIDALGTMLEGYAYAELWLNEKEFILEPVENLNFRIKNECP